MLARGITRSSRVVRRSSAADGHARPLDHFVPILSSYRHTAIVVALALMGAVCTGFLAAGHGGSGWDPLMALFCVSLTGLGFGGLAMGHRMVRRNLVRAARSTRAVMAAVHRDALTGVFTRSYFMEALRNDVHHGSDKSLGYMLLDMDNLKVLNDGAGHAAGDAALAHLAKIIGQVMPGAIVGRLGGDEFGIAIPGCDNRGALRRLAEELLRRLDQPVNIVGRPVRLSATVGFALAPADATDVDDLIAKADLALYKSDERHRRFVERELRAALLMDELELHYQPVFGADMRVRSHEALLRWKHTVRGMIPPAQFIAIAEESDLIDKLGEWVLRRACADLERLGTPVAVNVSPAQLRRPDFAGQFGQVVEELGVDPGMLIVEVTETVPMVAGAVEQANLDAIRLLGLKVAIDDFGAGHASLQYLRGFAFDIIKIDRTYIANLGDNRIDAMIVGAICDIARSLKVDVIAEGVETEGQLDMLRRAGCSAFPGYLLGRPAPLKRLAVADAA
jgi:diguanylate cyclase (GGDEF)-like protein